MKYSIATTVTASVLAVFFLSVTAVPTYPVINARQNAEVPCNLADLSSGNGDALSVVSQTDSSSQLRFAIDPDSQELILLEEGPGDDSMFTFSNSPLRPDVFTIKQFTGGLGLTAGPTSFSATSNGTLIRVACAVCSSQSAFEDGDSFATNCLFQAVTAESLQGGLCATATGGDSSAVSLSACSDSQIAGGIGHNNQLWDIFLQESLEH